MKTIRAFIREHHLRMDCEPTDRNPSMADDEWSRSANHWLCTIKCGRRDMGVHFSQEAAHTSEPKIEEVLDCLASDAATYLNSNSFEDWANELGFDSDSRKAEKTYHSVEIQIGALIRLIGESEVRNLAFETERL